MNRSEFTANDAMHARTMAHQARIDHAQLMRTATARLTAHAPRTLSDMLAMPRPSFVARMLSFGTRHA